MRLLQLLTLVWAARLAAGDDGCPVMDELWAKAAARAGLTLDEALSIDDADPPLYDQLGEAAIKQFSTHFYARVYQDEWDEFRDLFKDRPIEQSVQNQFEFLVQRLGGPPVYSERKGPPRLMWRHAGFPCTNQTAARWLLHAGEALDAAPAIAADPRLRLARFFTFMANLLVVHQESREACGMGRGGGGGGSWWAEAGMGPGMGRGAGRGLRGGSGGMGHGGMGRGAGGGRWGGWGAGGGCPMARLASMRRGAQRGAGGGDSDAQRGTSRPAQNSLLPEQETGDKADA